MAWGRFDTSVLGWKCLTRVWRAPSGSTPGPLRGTQRDSTTTTTIISLPNKHNPQSEVSERLFATSTCIQVLVPPRGRVLNVPQKVLKKKVYFIILPSRRQLQRRRFLEASDGIRGQIPSLHLLHTQTRTHAPTHTHTHTCTHEPLYLICSINAASAISRLLPRAVLYMFCTCTAQYVHAVKNTSAKEQM